ncbi:BTAD domain-containing putative transcriptional regulator [Nocardioides sp.]|uniref:nSTAND1 domain-containing NTPase n=1 Tax=Nocardioides sp. TaxID=35761 RepID=UPI002F415679
MRIGILGPLEVDERSARLGTRDRVVLAALAMRPGEVLSLDRLADAVWGVEPPASWAKNLQGCVSRLRKLLGPDLIETAGQGYRLGIPAASVDGVEFCRAAGRSRELLTLHECERARYVATQALDLWRGRPLPELEGWEPGAAETHRLLELRAELEELVVEASLAAGHHAEVLTQAAAMVEAAPLRERRWALLAQAQYLAGRQMEALRTLRRVRVVLARDLGLDPGPDLVALEQAILRQDPALAVEDATPARDDVSPYPGLAAYGEDDAESFVGREGETRSCLERLAEARLLAVVGPSGSGKSSLLRAGLAASLRRDGTHTVVLTPGRHPMDALTAAAVRRDTVVLVDQAEEAFALCKDEDERGRFFEALVAHTERGRVVLALRADHTGDLATLPAVALLVERGLFLLGPMSAESLRQAIETPARQRGLVLEHGLTDLLVREIEGEPGALPLLSHALRETWLRHEGRTLTVAGYQASGGVRGAVAQSAESLYVALGEAERSQLRDLVLRLVVPGPRGEPVRGEVPRRQVVVDPVQEQLIDRMVEARLVTSDAEAIELAHEAVVRAWPRLRGWLEDDLEGQRTRHHLTQAAEDWAGAGFQDSDLYRGTRLAATREWITSSEPRLTETEQRFLTASEEMAAAEDASTAELANARGRMVRRLRFALAGAAVLLVLALITGFVAVGQTGRARDEADAARARQLSAEALGDADIPLSTLLALAAVHLDDTPQTRASLATLLARNPAFLATSSHVGETPGRLVRSPDGGRVAVYGLDNVVSLVDVATGKVTRRYDTDGPGPVNDQFFALGAMAFSPDGRTLAVGAQTYSAPAIVLLDGRTLRPLRTQPAHLPPSAKARDVDFSADGRHVAVSYMLLAPGIQSGVDEEIDRTQTRVWDLRRLDRRPKTIEVPWVNLGETMALSPHAKRVYLSAPVAAYSVRTGERLWKADVDPTWLPMDLSADGRHLAVIPREPGLTVDLVSTRDGHVERTLQGASGGVIDVTFSDDDSQVAAVSQGPELLIWRRTGSQPTQTITIDDPGGVQLAPDASRAYVSDAQEGTIMTWDLTGGSSYLRLVATYPKLMTRQVSFLRTSDNGTHFAEYGDDLTLFNATTGRVTTARDPGEWGFYTPGSWRPDDQRFAIGTLRGRVQIFDEAGTKLRDTRVSRATVTDVDYSADGATLAVDDVSGHVGLRDAETLEPKGTPVDMPASTYGLTLAPDGRTAFVMTRRGVIRPGETPTFPSWALLDLQTGRVLRTGSLHGDGYYDDFSPDGRHVAIGLGSGRMLILDPRTGASVPTQNPAHDFGIGWLAWSVDGSRIISTGGGLEIWDASTGQIQDTVTAPGGGIGTFRRDSSHITIVNVEGRVFDWNPSRRYAVEYACRIAGRDMTADEWRTYVGSQPRFQVCPS